MRGFKTHFPIKGIRTDVTVTQLEDNTFGVEFESVDVFDEDKDPKQETVSSMNEPNLLVQKTKGQGWVIIREGSFDLDQNDLEALGKAIEENSPTLL